MPVALLTDMPGLPACLVAADIWPRPRNLRACPAACAGAGDADKAFQLYSEMKAAGVPSDKMVYASVVKACSQHISRLPPSERCAGEGPRGWGLL